MSEYPVLDQLSDNAEHMGKRKVMRKVMEQVPKAINTVMNMENKLIIMDVHQAVSDTLLTIQEEEGLEY